MRIFRLHADCYHVTRFQIGQEGVVVPREVTCVTHSSYEDSGRRINSERRERDGTQHSPLPR